MNELESLVDMWHTEVSIFHIRSKLFLQSVSNMSSLNSKIYKYCKENNIDYKSLELNKPNKNQ